MTEGLMLLMGGRVLPDTSPVDLSAGDAFDTDSGL